MDRIFWVEKYIQFLQRVFLRGIVIGIFLFQIAECIAQNQDIHFKHLTTDNGLSQSLVRCIFQDSYGFIWLGTDNGLNRYDGRNFVVYKHSSSDDHTINNSDIRSIFEDSKGNLWIGTFLGLDLYDRKLDRFVRFKKKIPQAIITGILEDSKGNLWISTRSGLYLYNADSDVLNIYTKESNRLSDNVIRCMALDKNDNVWLGTARGLNYFDKTTETFVSYFSNLKEKNSLQSDKISALRFDYKNRLWIGTDKGLDVFVNPQEVHEQPIFKSFRHDPLNGRTIAGGAILSLLEDSEHNLWIGMEAKGLSRLDLQKFNIDNPWFYHYKNDPEVASSLSHNSVYSLYEDKQKNLLVGTYSKGLDVFSRSSMRFSLVFNSKEKGYSLSSKYVNVFFEEGDFLWLGTDNGLNQVNKKNGKIEIFFNDPFNPRSISSNWVHSIFKDSRGNLWIGTRAGGLNKFNYSSGTFTRFLNNPLDSNSIPSNNIFAIYEDTKKNLWLGSMEGGLILFDRDKLRFRNFTKENASLATNYVTSIAEAPNNSFWLLTIKTLDRFAPGKKTISYTHNPKDTQTISSDINICLHKDRNNNLWIGTDNGINLLNTKTNKFKTYTIKNGLPDNTVKIILEDDHGNLWLGTNKGISKFIDALKYPTTPKFKNYSPYDGLQGFDFNRRAGFKDSKGGMYFGGANGVNYFHPDSINDNTDIPEVRITDFLILNKPLQIGAENSPLKQNIYFTEEIKLSYRQSVFTIKFVALNYISPERNEYAYKMEGFDNEWNYIGNDAEAAYMNLKPGRYTFRVKASNNDGVWNEKGASLKIIVQPPWWATWWFKVIIALFVLLIIFIIFYIRFSYYRNREKELNYLVQQRTKELKITNQLLMERQQHIEEQAAELMAQTENLKETNDLLTEKQIYIQEQSHVLEETNKQLSFLNATKDKIFSIIAHDLRNPFHTVMGFSELLMLKFNKLPQEKVSKYIQLIHTSSLNGNNLLENLLHWSRSQTGKISFEPEVIHLLDIVRQTLNFLQINAHNKNITIETDIQPSMHVYADTNMVLTIFRNLISNAIKFTPDNGRIKITAITTEPFVKIAIEDNGIGIDEKIQRRLFDMNANITSKGTNDEQGTGLGLILCKEFVERHNCKIWVESKLGEGSRFMFTLPGSMYKFNPEISQVQI